MKKDCLKITDKFQLVLKSSSKKSLIFYVSFLKNIFIKLNLKDITFFSFKRKIIRITLLKSPHVYKKAKEQFEIKYYKVLITLKNITINSNFIKYLLLNKPKSINVKLKR